MEINIFVGGDEFRCRQYNGGVDIYDATINKYLGDIEGLSLPDLDDEDVNMDKFNKEIENWLSENYY